jgi:hypothetical protein
MNEKGWHARLEEADSIPEIFDLVKDAVRQSMNRERSGLMIGLQDIGIAENGFVGAFYPMGSNAIIINRSVLKRVASAHPGMLKPYIFSTLMHEYLHALGIVQEVHTRAMTYQISKECFGSDHPATRISENSNFMLADIMKAGPEAADGTGSVSLVEGADRDSMRYIG